MSIIKEEIIGADFRDKRLSKRYVKIVEQIQGNTDMSFPKAIPDDWSELKALYRFFTNERVTHKNILMPHRDNTVERCMKEDVVLFIQDTTYLNYSHHPYTEGLGSIGTKENFIGMLVHNGYAVSGEDKKPLGLLYQKVMIRKGKVKKRKETEKESIKWQEGLDSSNRLLKNHKKVIQVCDREADIYFFIKKIQELGQGFVIRCAWDRKTESGHIFEDIKKADLQGYTRIKIERNGKRKGRTVKAGIKSCKVKILAPKSIDRQGPALDINVVIVEEVGPPNKESKIHWVLLTSENIEGKEACLKVVKYYQSRWLIEEFHKGLKSGCKIEERQLQTRAQLEKCLGMFSILCYNLLLMRHEVKKGIAGEIILNPIQMNFLKKKFRKESRGKITPQRALRLVARQGGFIGRKSDGSPGWLTLMRGMYDVILAEAVYVQVLEDMGKG
jgi:hypothetical protein